MRNKTVKYRIIIYFYYYYYYYSKKRKEGVKNKDEYYTNFI